ITSPVKTTFYPYTTLFRSKTYLQPGAENSRGRSSVHSSLVEEKRGRNGAVSARLCPLSRWRPHLSEEGVSRVWASRNVKRYILRSEEHTSELQSSYELFCR